MIKHYILIVLFISFISISCQDFIQTSERSCQNTKALALQLLANQENKSTEDENQFTIYDAFIFERLGCADEFKD